METQKIITERAEVVINNTTIKFEFEHAEGIDPTTLRANVDRQNKNAEDRVISVSIVNANYTIATDTMQMSVTNLTLADAAILAAISTGFESIINPTV